MDQSYLRMMMKVRHLGHPYSIKPLSSNEPNRGSHKRTNGVIQRKWVVGAIDLRFPVTTGNQLRAISSKVY